LEAVLVGQLNRLVEIALIMGQAQDPVNRPMGWRKLPILECREVLYLAYSSQIDQMHASLMLGLNRADFIVTNVDAVGYYCKNVGTRWHRRNGSTSYRGNRYFKE
jgi:hypothetical protein